MAIDKSEFSGLAIQRANIRHAKLVKAATEAIEAFKAAGLTPDSDPEELVKALYSEDFENMTKDEMEGKIWYVTERLLPTIQALKTDPESVYLETLMEEEAKLQSPDEAVASTELPDW